MKKILLRQTALLLLMLTLICLLPSCGNRTPVLEPAGDGTYYCKQTGQTYRLVTDTRYEAVGVGEAYGELHDGTLVRTLYEVRGLSARDWLVTDSGSLYCGASVTLPTLDGMNIQSIAICKSSVSTHTIATVTDRETVSRLIEICLTQKDPGLFAIGTPESFRLKLESPDWQGICYSLILRYYENGLSVYDKLTDEQAAEVEAEIARKEALLTEEQIAAGVTVEPELPAGYVPLTDDARVGITLKKYPYTAPDGTEGYEWDVIYDYGNYFLYDRFTQSHIPVWDILSSYLDGTTESESGTETETGTGN